MRHLRNICLTCLLALAAGPAFAIGHMPDPASLNYPGAPKRVYDDPPPSPYPMNYSEEIAQTLGVHNGGLELFNSGAGPRDDFMPAVSVGGGQSGAPMLKLQWRP